MTYNSYSASCCSIPNDVDMTLFTSITTDTSTIVITSMANDARIIAVTGTTNDNSMTNYTNATTITHITLDQMRLSTEFVTNTTVTG